MATGALIPPADDITESVLEFPDNFLLIDLCGEYDRNLTTIEDKLSVQILRRGNLLAVIGEKGPRQDALEVLKSLYQRLEQGRSLEAGDIDRELRMGPAGAPGPVDQIELFKGEIARVEVKTRKKLVEPRTEAQKAYVKALFDHEMAFGIGPAGTGKTYLAVAMAVSDLIQGKVDRLILSRPAVEAGERLGFLPGDLQDKIDPYLRPLYDALYDMLPGEQVTSRLESGEIEVAPLAFMRGRTLSRAFIILDEAQNTSAMQMKMFLTRLGEGSRMAITGDMTRSTFPAEPAQVWETLSMYSIACRVWRSCGSEKTMLCATPWWPGLWGPTTRAINSAARSVVRI